MFVVTFTASLRCRHFGSYRSPLTMAPRDTKGAGQDSYCPDLHPYVRKPTRCAAVSQRCTATSRRCVLAACDPTTVIVTTPITASRPSATVPAQPPEWKATAPSVPPALEPR